MNTVNTSIYRCRKLVILAGIIVCLSLFPKNSEASLLAVVNDANPDIYVMNPITGAVVNTLGIGVGNAFALAADDSTQTLYYSNGNSLRRIFYDGTGDALIGNLSGFTTFSIGLGFNPLTSTLYGVQFDDLFSINTTTAVTTLVASYAGTRLQGVDVDPQTGIIYAANENAARILQLNTDGTIVDLFAYPPGRFDIDGLAAGQGELYTVEDGTTDPITVLRLSDGSVVRTLNTPYVNSGGNSGGVLFAVVPEPATLLLLGLGLVGLGITRRRQL